jgi:hypothetical protein
LARTVSGLTRYFRIIALLGLAFLSPRALATATATDLRAEYSVDPIGLDTLVPG